MYTTLKIQFLVHSIRFEYENITIAPKSNRTKD